MKQDNGSEKEVWARVGTKKGKQASEGTPSPKNVEEKLLAAVDEFKKADDGGDHGGKGGKGGKHGGGDGADGGDASDGRDGGGGDGDHDSLVPGDIKKKGETISKIGIDTVVVYGATHAEVAKVGNISDL